MTALDLAIIILYFALLSLIGLYFSKRQTSRAEYFLGGRSMHWLLAAGSILATLLSTITYLNFPGEMIRYGVAYFSGLLILPFIPPLLNRLWIPILTRLPITSAYEYLEKRYDGSVRTLASLAFILRVLIWMGLVIYTASFAISEVTGWDLNTTIVAIGLVTTFYTTAGGIRTVIWTDNLQLMILFGGAVAIPVVVAVAIGSGPLAWWESFSMAGRAETPLFSLDLSLRTTVVAALLNIFCWEMCTQGADQMAVQRYLATPSRRAASKTVWMYTAGRLLLNGMLILCGLALFAFYLSRSGQPLPQFQQAIAGRADRVMLEFIVRELPAGVTGLLIAALLAAAMSSLSSGINSMSSIVVTDLLQRRGLLREETGGRLWVDKTIAMFGGLVGVVGAVGMSLAVERTDWNLLELTHRVNHIFVGPLAVLFFSGILWRRVGRHSTVVGFLCGTAISLYICFGREWFGLEKSISFLWVMPGSFLLGLAAALASSFFFRQPADPGLRELTYRGAAEAGTGA